MKKMRVALMTDLLDVKKEREPFYPRFIREMLKDPSIEITLVHAKPFPDQQLYKEAREIVLPRIELPFASRFVSYIRFCLTSKERFDVVHWFTPRLFPFFWIFPAKKIVVMTHGGGDVTAPTSFRSWTRFVFNKTLIWFSARVHAFIAVSGFGNRETIFAYHVPPDKVRTIYNSLDAMYAHLPDENERGASLRKYGLDASPYILYIGSFRLHKNLGNLVTAYILYREKNPAAGELLVLAGSSVNEYVKTFGELPSSPFSADIRFLGFVDSADMPALYCGAHALSMVSVNEGFGMPILEAWACKTPVITSNVSALPEVSGNAAIVVDPLDPGAIAEALAMLKDTEIRSTLIQRGYSRSRFFTVERTCAAVKMLYEELLFGPKPVRFNEAPIMPISLPYEL